MRTRPLPLALSVLLTACGGWSGSGPACRPIADPVPLPASLAESSGVAPSREHPGVHWSINDGGGVLYALAADGELLDSVVVDVPSRDWEDLALTPCGDGRGDCLWIADTGDNYGERGESVVYRLPEPSPGASGGAPEVEAFRVRFPDGPRDVEAMFVLPGGDLHLVSKGSDAPPTVYRYPPPLSADSVATLVEVQRLDSGARALPRQVTGAAAARDGSFVVVRTYETLVFMAVEDGRLRTIDGHTTNLRTLREPQGEGVGLGADGLVVLTSEAGPLGDRGALNLLRCEAPAAGGGEGG